MTLIEKYTNISRRLHGGPRVAYQTVIADHFGFYIPAYKTPHLEKGIIPEKDIPLIEWYVEEFGNEKTLQPATHKHVLNAMRINHMHNLIEDARKTLNNIDFDLVPCEIPEDVKLLIDLLDKLKG